MGHAMVLAALERIVMLMAEAEGVPTEFLDPITGEIMNDPVEWTHYRVSATDVQGGGIYDRDNLYNLLVPNKVGALTFSKHAIKTGRCKQLKHDIEAWKERHRPKPRLWQDNPRAK